MSSSRGVGVVSMILQCIAVAIALIGPLGTLAVDPPIGSETDVRKAARVAGWTGEKRSAGGQIEGSVNEIHGATREPSSEIVSQIYRYGQRKPVVQEMTWTGISQTETRLAPEP
jgi:hypothetical protein